MWQLSFKSVVSRSVIFHVLSLGYCPIDENSIIVLSIRVLNTFFEEHSAYCVIFIISIISRIKDI